MPFTFINLRSRGRTARMSERFSHLTFDCYGTLIDWRRGIQQTLTSTVGGIGISGQQLLASYVEAERTQETRYKKYREVLHDTVMSIAGALGVVVTDAAARKFADSVPEWPAFPDTAGFLREAGSKGFKRYVLSNVDTDILEETIRRNGLEVDGYVTAEEVKSYKPNPAHWVKFMEKTGAKSQKVLHCAQSVYHDLIPAQRMGIASAWVNRYDERLDPGVEPSYICDSLENLAKMLV